MPEILTVRADQVHPFDVFDEGRHVIRTEVFYDGRGPGWRPDHPVSVVLTVATVHAEQIDEYDGLPVLVPRYEDREEHSYTSGADEVTVVRGMPLLTLPQRGEA